MQCPETDDLVLLFASNAMADSQPQHLKSLQQRQGLATAEVTGSNVVWAREEREDKACKDMVSVSVNNQTQELVFTHEVECSTRRPLHQTVSSCSCGDTVPAATLHVSSHVPGRCSKSRDTSAMLLLLMIPQCSCRPQRGHFPDLACFAESGLAGISSAAAVESCRDAWRVRERHAETCAPCQACGSVQTGPCR